MKNIGLPYWQLKMFIAGIGKKKPLKYRTLKEGKIIYAAGPNRTVIIAVRRNNRTTAGSILK